MPFLVRKFGQRLLVTDAGQTSVLLPVLESQPHQRPIFWFAGIQQSNIDGQVGSQPFDGLLAQTSTFLVIEWEGLLDLTVGGQNGGTGGLVAADSCQVVSLIRIQF